MTTFKLQKIIPAVLLVMLVFIIFPLLSYIFNTTSIFSNNQNQLSTPSIIIPKIEKDLPIMIENAGLNNDFISSSSASLSASSSSLLPPSSAITHESLLSDLDDPLFYNKLSKNINDHKKEYYLMRNIIKSYASYHSKNIDNKESRYIILKPSAQFANRLRAYMGALYLAIVTKRLLFIDIGIGGYAARLDGVFKNPDFIWEFDKMPSNVRTIFSGKRTKRISFPYEGQSHGTKSMICDNWYTDNHEDVWELDTLAGFLPLIARNEQIRKSVLSNADPNDFNYQLVKHFPINTAENFEMLEVLLARNIFIPDTSLQSSIDNLIKNTYDKAEQWYKSQKIKFNGPPLILGIHLRTEYIESMNTHKRGLDNLKNEFNWFLDCGNLLINNNDYKNINQSNVFVFIAADERRTQVFIDSLWNKDRVYYQKFEKTGSTLDGIKDAVIDMVVVGSFDYLITTPHSSYSEMSSLIGQPRRLNNNELLKKVNEDNIYQLPINRPMLPMVTHTGWEIDKLNNYLFGRAIDIDIDEPTRRYLPIKLEHDPFHIDYKNKNMCKLQISAGIGWMHAFQALKSFCYNPEYHHPGVFFSK